MVKEHSPFLTGIKG